MRRKGINKVFINLPNNNDIDLRAVLLQQIRHQANSENTDNESPSPTPLANNIFETLNTDVFGEIMSFLKITDLKKLPFTCKVLNKLSARNLGYLKFIVTKLGYPTAMQFKTLGRLNTQNTVYLNTNGLIYKAGIVSRTNVQIVLKLVIISKSAIKEKPHKNITGLLIPQTYERQMSEFSLGILKKINTPTSTLHETEITL